MIGAGKVLYVPKIDKAAEGKMDFLRVHGEEDLRSFPAGTWGIREPPSEWDGRARMNGQHCVHASVILL